MKNVYASVELPNYSVYSSYCSLPGDYAEEIPDWFIFDKPGTRMIFVSGFLGPVGVDSMAITGYDWIEQAVSTTPEDWTVELHIDSPGGILHPGLERCIEIIQDRADTVAYVDNIATSAAYMLARACKRIVSIGRTPLVGSIGAFSLYYDTSQFNQNIGIVPVLIRVGNRKAAGVDGVFNQETREYLESKLRETFQAYLDLFDRPIPEAWVTGETFTVASAPAGMVDEIMEIKPMQNEEPIYDELEEFEASLVVDDEEAEAVEAEEEEDDEVVPEEEYLEFDDTIVEAEENVPVLPIKRISEDDGEEVFDRLVKKYGSKTKAWLALEKQNYELYLKLRNR